MNWRVLVFLLQVFLCLLFCKLIANICICIFCEMVNGMVADVVQVLTCDEFP